MTGRKGMKHGPAIERLMSRTVATSNGCLLWLGAVNSAGYGNITNDAGRDSLAHRVAYEHAHGPIPADLVCDHLCGEKRCVNPDHIEVVTHAENLARGGYKSGRRRLRSLQRTG